MNEALQPMPSINDLKAAVYDKIVEIENHQAAIKQKQDEIGELNQQIVAKMREAK